MRSHILLGFIWCHFQYLQKFYYCHLKKLCQTRNQLLDAQNVTFVILQKDAFWGNIQLQCWVPPRKQHFVCYTFLDANFDMFRDSTISFQWVSEGWSTGIMVLKECSCLEFESLKEQTKANIWRIELQYHAMGAIAKNVEHGCLIVVIRNSKMSQLNCDLGIPLWDSGWEWCFPHEILSIHVGQCPCELNCNVKFSYIQCLHSRIVNVISFL